MKHRGIKDSVPSNHIKYMGHFAKEGCLKEGHNWVQFIPIALSLLSKSGSQGNQTVSTSMSPIFKT